MARRKHRRDDDQHTRDARVIANTPSVLRLLEELDYLSRPPARSALQEVEDRREFFPEVSRPVRTVQGTRAALKAGEGSAVRYGTYPPETIGFENPARVARCVRRRERREVLFARGRGGSRRRQRKPHYDDWSKVRC